MNGYPQAVDRTDGRSMRTGFLRNAEQTPDAVALVVQNQTYTYGEVDELARKWARAMVQELGRPARRVAVFASRSMISYVGVMAALYAGAAFVPLNKKFPAARTAEMLRQADVDVVIVDKGSAHLLEDALTPLGKKPKVLLPDPATDELNPPSPKVLKSADLDAMAPLQDLPPLSPFEIAYLLFTSGSTGTPKGVPVRHSNVMHFVDVMTRRFQINSEDRFSQTFDQTFDPSIFDIFVCWENGASLYVLQPLDLLAPSRFVKKHEITIWYSVPSIPALMRKKGTLKPNAFPSLRWSLFAGEALPEATAAAWQDAAPGAILENLYGPTELTITCFAYRWDKSKVGEFDTGGFVPMGRPNPGLCSAIVDADLKPVPQGEQGELLVAGPQTVPGYWNNPEQTADRFVYLDIPNGPPMRFYRTGDRVMKMPDDNYLYLGRVDYQIKVLGNRVELSEIEVVLLQYPGVVESVAMGWPMREGHAEGVVAFLTGADLDPDAVKNFVRKKLPDYMTPDRIIIKDEMPLNPNGKIDRKLLCASLDQEKESSGA